jgi:hypothetical protein
MPNHIKNKIELLGPIEDIDALIKRFSTHIPAAINKTHDGELVICKKLGKEWGFCWFNLKTGMAHDRGDLNQVGLPEGYEIEVNESILLFPDFTKVIPPPDDPAYRDEPSQKEAETSPNWWYRWNIEHWGTKWGSYSCEQLAINQYTFETAWSGVPRIINVMSKAFPSVTIKYSWADEDTGYNCGKQLYHNGLLSEEKPKGGSKEAYELAFELRPDNATNYQFKDGKYEYVDSE